MSLYVARGQKAFGRIVQCLAIALIIIAGINILPQTLAVGPRNSATVPDMLEQSPKLHTVFFYSPTCPHCRKVIKEYLPGIQDKIGPSLQIVFINTTNPQGKVLFEAAMERFQVPKARQGVPILIMGNVILISDTEILQNFAKVVESYRLAGGAELPDVPSLKEELAKAAADSQAPSTSEANVKEQKRSNATFITTGADTAAAMEMALSLKSRLLQDPVGNILALLVLLGLVLSIIRFAKVSFSKGVFSSKNHTHWVIPLFSLTGLGISAYLAYGKMTYAPTLCGPVGNCNAVQLSPYSSLFGTIPVALMGVGGYLAVILAWLVSRCGQKRLADAASLLLVLMILSGTIFSIYLTFLEPFVIGAVCMWCLASAVLIGGLMWTTTN